MEIKLSNIIKIDDLTQYKGHFALWNGSNQPLDVFVEDKQGWKDWQEYRPGKDAFSRDFIFSFMRYYPLGDEYWLFGGIWKVVKRNKDSYKVELCDLGKEYIGRLLVQHNLKQKNIRVNLENHYHKMIVSEIFEQEYSGEMFPGFYNIDIQFKKLKHIIKMNKSSWKDTLGRTDGVYLITDTKNGKKYVGIAHSGEGIWSRWKEYINNGHGSNKRLKELINKEGITYAEENFKFAILETYRFGTAEDTIHFRETYWKDVFMSRDEKYGYNEK